MTFKDFVKKSIEQDERNVFEPSDDTLEIIPEIMKDFYKYSNPIDVEVSINDASVHFFPIDEIEELQEEYKLGKDKFVFASCNGDPVYLEKNTVSSGVFGSKGFISEVLANDIFTYLEKINSV